MKHVYLITACFAMLLSSCSKVVTDDHSGESMSDIIGWKVSADGLGTATRALIEDYTDLRDACTEFENQEAEKIGLLGNYIKDGQTKVAFDNADLWWWEKEDGNPFKDDYGNDSYWNYSGDDVYWTDNVDYTFKAYFPKSKVELQPGSGANKLLVVYDSEVSQYDLLVAHKTMRAKSENPVGLLMKNALSALRFDFQCVEPGVTDQLLSCWLENVSANGFYTSSTLNFEENVVWPQSTPNPVGTPFYYWEPNEPLDIRSDKSVVAYATPASESKGNEYANNSGWILIIPQSSQSAGTVKLCFKTATGGSAVYSINLPAYEFKAGHRYTYHVKITSTGIDLSLTIADWNERKSSYEIDFN